MVSPRLSVGSLFLIIGALVLVGCESRPNRRAMMEEARRSVPSMAADEPFFDGAIIAHLTLKGDTGGRGGSGDSDSGGGRGRGGGGRHGGGRGGGGRGMRQPSDDSDGVAPSPAMHASAMPAAMLRLRLENTTQAEMDVEVRGLDSQIGNFAVRPDKLIVMPGQSEEPDPMESLLGVDTLSLPVTVTLRWNGRTETKVMMLQVTQPVPEPPAAPSTAPTPTPTGT